MTVSHFCSKENIMQKYDHNIPKGMYNHPLNLLDAHDNIFHFVHTENPAFKTKMGF